MYLLVGVLHYAHNYLRRQVYKVSAVDPGAARADELRFEFEPTGKPGFLAGQGSPGRAQLYVDGRLAGQAEFPVTTPIGLNPGGLTCGSNPGAAVVACGPGVVLLRTWGVVLLRARGGGPGVRTLSAGRVSLNCRTAPRAWGVRG